MNPKNLANPESSCGSRFTILPNGSNVWVAIGPAAEAWDSVRHDVAKIIESDKYVDVDVRVQFYMIGRSLAKAMPYIMVFSDNIAARKELRNEVRDRGVLKDFPWIRLGEAPFDHNHHRHKTATDEPPQQDQKDETPDDKSFVPRSSIKSPAISEPPEPAISEPSDAGSSHHSRAFSRLVGSVTTWSISTSISRRDSHISDTSMASEATTRRTSIGSIPEQTRSEASTIKAEDPESEGEESSAEDELLSSSDSSDNSSPMPIDGGLSALHCSIIRQVLVAYGRYRQRRPSGGSGATQGSAGPSHGDSVSSNGGSTNKGKKRVLGSNSTETQSSADEPSQPDVETKRRRINQRGRVLACPYWKRDQDRFRRCYKYNLTEVKYVKQHLRREHRSPFRCLRCKQAFAKEALLEDHQLSDVRCTVRDKVQGDDISTTQCDLLKEKGTYGSTQEQQWFLVWDIVFPNCNRPSSPYLDADLSEDICEFREFSTTEGVTIVGQMLRDANVCLENQERETHAVLSSALEVIYRRWLGQRSLSRGEGSNGGAQGADGREEEVIDQSGMADISIDNMDDEEIQEMLNDFGYQGLPEDALNITRGGHSFSGC